MGLVDLVVCALATHQAVAIYRYSSLLAGVRQWQEIGCYSGLLSEGQRLFVEQLLGCDWCLSVHVAFWLAFAYSLLSYVPAGVGFVPLWILAAGLKLIVSALAVSQLANLLHKVCGSPYKTSSL